MNAKTIISFLSSLALLFTASCVDGKKEAKTMKKDFKYVIDVRSSGEYASGHVEGAVLIPHTEIGEKITSVVPDKSSPVALYCRSGHRAGIALDAMKAMGYEDVENLGGVSDAAELLQKKIVR